MMRLFIAIFIIALILSPAMGQSGELLNIPNEFIIPLPEDWALDDTSSSYPYHIVERDNTAELFVFRSYIAATETINNKTDLRSAVEMVISDVLPELSAAELQRSTGYLRGDHASFVLDFISTDRVNVRQTYHRLNGILYRLPDNSQVLFTLWVKTSPENFPFHEPALDQMLTGFSFRGERDPNVFRLSSQADYWQSVMFIGVIIGLIFYISRFRKHRSTLQFADKENFWRCSCGRVNAVRLSTCRRCGNSQVQ